ncbi:hypothetical protein ACU4GI_35500 [Cupriavidus basilensis]|uniref:hypothetical protein n=1 Tax=Cupriavidus basilensis TaxID=68895 RepID=UPI0023E818A3|nr:hypothetical protein [Cupriavidus basilensis]
MRQYNDVDSTRQARQRGPAAVHPDRTGHQKAGRRKSVQGSRGHMKIFSGISNGWAAETEATDGGIWKNTIAAASHALETVALVEHGVGMTLKLQRKVRALRERLRTTQAELDRYRDMHAHAMEALRRTESVVPQDTSQLRAEGEALQMRHRAYKLLVEHYARAGIPIDLAVFTRQRRRVLQHILFQQRRGVAIAEISVDDIAFLLR